MASLVEVAKALYTPAERRDRTKRAKRATNEYNVGSTAAGVGYLGNMFQRSYKGKNYTLRTAGSDKLIRRAQYRPVGGQLYAPARPLAETKAGGVRSGRVPTMTVVERGGKRPGVATGRLAPAALVELMGNEAPGPKVYGARLRTGGRVYGGTARGLARTGTQGALMVGGVAEAGHGLTTLGRMSREAKRKREQ